MAELVFDDELLAFLRSVIAGDKEFQRLNGSIDANALSPRDALMFGLPPPPERGTPSAELWQALAASRTMTGPGVPFVSALRTGYNRLGLKGHLETSRNWSGAVIASPYRSQPFDFLIGTWIVPDVRIPASGAGQDYACSTWIGFDGHRRNSRSLPQLGTVQELIADTAGNYRKSVRAWWQWWHTNDTQGPNYVDFSNVSVEPRQRVIATMFSIPGLAVLMKLANLTTGEASQTVLAKPPAPGLEPRMLDAECVLERPKRVNPPYTNFMPPEFDETSFQCYATVRGTTRLRSMQGARLIRMIHRQGSDIETIATPDPVQSREIVTVRYCLN